MVITITIISVLLFVTILFVLACIVHILKIQKELKSISEEQSRQNEDIRNLMVAYMSVIQAFKEASEIEQINKLYNHSKIKGEA
jgi:ABC-type uncharacterized transport system fused permease/ATPase subunit